MVRLCDDEAGCEVRRMADLVSADLPSDVSSAGNYLRQTRKVVRVLTDKNNNELAMA